MSSSVTLIDVLRVCDEIQKYFICEDFLHLERASRDIKLGYPDIELSQEQSLRVISFLERNPSPPTQIIQDRLRRTTASFFTEFAILLAMPLFSMFHLFKEIRFHPTVWNSSSDYVPYLAKARENSANLISMFVSQSVPDGYIDNISIINNVIFDTNFDPSAISCCFSKDNFPKIKKISIQSLTSEIVQLVTSMLQSSPNKSPKPVVELVLHEFTFFQSSKNLSETFKYLILITDSISIEMGFIRDATSECQSILNFLSADPDLDRLFFDKLKSSKFFNASSTLKMYLARFKSSLTEIHFKQVWTEDLRKFPKLTKVAFKNDLSLLRLNSLKILDINLSNKDFDFADISNYRDLEKVCLSNGFVIKSSISMKCYFKKLSFLFMQADLCYDIGILPCSLEYLELDDIPTQISMTIDSPIIHLVSKQYQGIKFTSIVNTIEPEGISYDSFFDSEGPFSFKKLILVHRFSINLISQFTAEKFPLLRNIVIRNCEYTGQTKSILHAISGIFKRLRELESIRVSIKDVGAIYKNLKSERFNGVSISLQKFPDMIEFERSL
jgi:hypothetical protein